MPSLFHRSILHIRTEIGQIYNTYKYTRNFSDVAIRSFYYERKVGIGMDQGMLSELLGENARRSVDEYVKRAEEERRDAQAREEAAGRSEDAALDSKAQTGQETSNTPGDDYWDVGKQLQEKKSLTQDTVSPDQGASSLANAKDAAEMAKSAGEQLGKSGPGSGSKDALAEMAQHVVQFVKNMLGMDSKSRDDMLNQLSDKDGRTSMLENLKTLGDQGFIPGEDKDLMKNIRDIVMGEGDLKEKGEKIFELTQDRSREVVPDGKEAYGKLQEEMAARKDDLPKLISPDKLEEHLKENVFTVQADRAISGFAFYNDSRHKNPEKANAYKEEMVEAIRNGREAGVSTKDMRENIEKSIKEQPGLTAVGRKQLKDELRAVLLLTEKGYDIGKADNKSGSLTQDLGRNEGKGSQASSLDARMKNAGKDAQGAEKTAEQAKEVGKTVAETAKIAVEAVVPGAQGKAVAYLAKEAARNTAKKAAEKAVESVDNKRREAQEQAGSLDR